MNQKQIDWTLIRKQIDDCLTDEERERLERWVGDDEGRRHFVEHACQYYKRDLPVIDETRISEAWLHFIQSQREKRRRRIFSLCTWSAAAVVILVVGTWVWLSNSPEIPIKRPSPMIAWGSNSVRLIISDGTEINLASKEPGQTIVDKGVNVQLNKESLSYEENQLTKDTLYHTVEVPRGGEYTLVLSDGTIVNLNSESELKYPVLFTGDTRTVRVSGEAYFEVSKNKEKPFIVKTTKGDVEVLGTKFYISAYATTDVFETSLIEGKVKVHTAYEDMTLYPKDKAVLENGLLTRKQIDDMDTYRWRDGLYCFKNLSFDDVLKQFEIYYDIRFVKENPQIANPKLNGKFRLIDGVDYALRVLQREVGFSFRRDDEANVIYLK